MWKHTPCEGVNTFLGDKKRIEERESLGRNGQIASCPLLQKIFNPSICKLFYINDLHVKR